MTLELSSNTVLAYSFANQQSSAMAKGAREKRELGKRIARAREHVSLNKTQLAAEIGITRSAPSQWEGGNTEPTPQNLRKIADLTGVNYEWLALNKGQMLPEPAEIDVERSGFRVPIRAWVTAGSNAEYLPVSDHEALDWADPPALTEKTIAFQIRGKSLGEFFDRWVVYFDDVRSPLTSDLIGKLCVVWVADGRVMVKTIKRAANGLYDLLSNTEPPVEGVAVNGAARVKLMAPR